jgi:hypothetical protein
MPDLLKRLLGPPLTLLAALWVVFEEVLVAWVQRQMARLAQVPAVARLEAWLRTLPPYVGATLFLVPTVLLLPVKLAAVVLLAKGQVLAATAVLVLGKVVGTAIAARLYRILHPALSTLPWFVRAETWVFLWRDRLHAWLYAQPAWLAAVTAVRALRAQVRDWFRSL